MARMRRKNRELEEELRQLRAGGQRPTQEAQPAKPAVAEKPAAAVADPEPADKDSPAWDKWKIRDQERRLAAIEGRTQEDHKQAELNTQISRAKDEFRNVQSEYIRRNPDYVNAFKVGYENYTRSLRIAHPEWTNQEIVNTADYRLLLYAGQMAKKGVNPAEAIYDYCIETLGYRPGSVKPAQRQQREEQIEEEVDENGDFIEVSPRREVRKPNLRVIEKNKRRSANGLGGGGQGSSARLTRESVANMTLGEMANLDTDVWSELERLA